MIWLIALPYSTCWRAWVNMDLRNPFLQLLQSPLANPRVFSSNIYGGKKTFSSCLNLRYRLLWIISGWEYLHIPDGWPLHSIQRVSNISTQQSCSDDLFSGKNIFIRPPVSYHCLALSVLFETWARRAVRAKMGIGRVFIPSLPFNWN